MTVVGWLGSSHSLVPKVEGLVYFPFSSFFLPLHVIISFSCCSFHLFWSFVSRFLAGRIMKKLCCVVSPHVSSPLSHPTPLRSGAFVWFFFFLFWEVSMVQRSALGLTWHKHVISGSVSMFAGRDRNGTPQICHELSWKHILWVMYLMHLCWFKIMNFCHMLNLDEDLGELSYGLCSAWMYLKWECYIYNLWLELLRQYFAVFSC